MNKNLKDIYKKIELINIVTNLTTFETYSKYSIEQVLSLMNELSSKDILFILWKMGITDEYNKDDKTIQVILNYKELVKELIVTLEKNSNFIQEYIKENMKNLQDLSLEMMHETKDYDNENLKYTIDTVNKIIGDQK